jgi:histidine ammonia-lyase
MNTIILNGNDLTIKEIEKIIFQKYMVKISDESTPLINKSRQIVEKILSSNEVVYGINTGFGYLKNKVIPSSDIEKLQENLIISHCAGVGELFSPEISKTMMLLRANALIKGFSGIRLEVIQRLLDFINLDITPLVPSQGSVGSSGDLAPLSHMALPLLGKGKVLFKNEIKHTLEVLKENNLEPITLKAKEGLALINGTQAMTAVGCITIIRANKMIDIADGIAAMSVDALKGSKQAFRKELHIIRPHKGQLKSAENLYKLLEDSEIMESHVDCDNVQDAYSLRCTPQVHGAIRDTIEHVEKVLSIEINSVTDNPIVLPETEEVISGGNFHGEPVAIAMDSLSIALSELGNISERRTERLVNPQLSNGLPAFLTPDGGLNSGYMIAQYAAAALVSENKSLAHPASVDSIPTSANQEDHVSMGTIAARKSAQILLNTERVLAIETCCASQGLDFRKPLNTGKGCKHLFEIVREDLTTLKEDRNISEDIDLAHRIITSDKFYKTFTEYFDKKDIVKE